jgi:hypothetical protein
MPTLPGLPANVPRSASARLPETYQSAKTALSQCARVDECWEWATKAEALASYAKQADDDALYDFAVKIRARAIRRCGELLRAISPGRGGQPAHSTRGRVAPSRNAAARDAGLSRDQKRDALRVANVPEAEFEAAVEGQRPTITALADRGTRHPAVDLQGGDPREFARSTEGQGMLRRAAEFMTAVEPVVVVRGAFPRERKVLRDRLAIITPWLRTLHILLKREG